MALSPEKVIKDYLRTNLDVSVSGVSPSNTQDPWVRLTMIDSPSADGRDHLIEALFQIDCFAGRGGSQDAAEDLAADVRLLIRDAHLETHAGAIVTGSRASTSRVPDSTFEPAMERYIVSATVWLHE